MSLVGYLMLLIVFGFDGIEAGGHGHHHHSHLRIHLPEFLHHDHHTKVITIHHHHHKPKEHHHHHHHHPKPMVPLGHHYHHHHKKMHHVSKDHILTAIPVVHSHRTHLKPLHDHSENEQHQIVHHNPPIYNYKPSTTSFDNSGTFTPAVPAITSSVSHSFNAGVPQVHGVQHTVQQVTSYDTSPVAIPNAQVPGYKVTEEGEEEDTFTAVNSLHEDFPAPGFDSGSDFTQDFSQNLVGPLAEMSSQPTSNSQDTFLPSPQLTSVSADGIESYTRNANYDPFASAPTSPAVQSALTSLNQPSSYDNSKSNDPINLYSGDIGGTNYIGDYSNNEEYPVSFHID